MARALRLAGGIGLAAFLVHALVSAGDGPDPLFDLWLYNGLQLLATVTLVLGGLRASGLERAGWLVLGAGVAAYTVGDIYYSLALSGDAAPRYPSLADVAYSAFYPASFAGLVLLFRARTGGLHRTVWLDGTIAAFGVAALAVAVVFEYVVGWTQGSTAAVATNLVYPLGDATLLGAVVCVLVLNGRKLDPTWLLIGAGLAATAIADGFFLIQSATGSYVEGGPLDALWPACTLLLAQAPWLRTQAQDRAAKVGGFSSLPRSAA